MRQELIYKVEAIASGLASLDSRLNICVNRNLAVEMEAETEDGEFWLKPDYAKEKIAQINDLKSRWNEWSPLTTKAREILDLLEMTESEEDPVLLDLERESGSLQSAYGVFEEKTTLSGPDDIRNCILTIHSGAGGTEAQDWASILFRMYLRFAEKKGYSVEIMDQQEGEAKGLVKSTTLFIRGKFAYGMLKVENGVHRLIRISPFDSAKRRHTSFVSVFVLPEVDDSIQITINDADLRIDTYRSGGSGGQNVNKVESAVRITHLPTNTVVACQTERAQLQNKANAMKMLKAKLYNLELEKKNAAKQEIEDSKLKIEWGSQIRSYTFQPFQLVKDHRSGYETSDINRVVDGSLEEIIKSVLVVNQ